MKTINDSHNLQLGNIALDERVNTQNSGEIVMDAFNKTSFFNCKKAYMDQNFSSCTCQNKSTGTVLVLPGKVQKRFFKSAETIDKKIEFLVHSLLGISQEIRSTCFQENPQNILKESFEDVFQGLSNDFSAKYRTDLLIRCIQNLIKDVPGVDAIRNLLGIIGEYYGAQQAILLDLEKSEKRIVISNIWTKTEVAVDPNILFIPKQELKDVVQLLRENGQCVFYMPEHMFSEESVCHKIIKTYNVQKLFVTPLYKEDKMTAIIAVGNVFGLHEDLSFLHAIGLFIKDLLKKNRLFKQLETLSYTDGVTGLYNRNKYVERLDELGFSNLRSLGVIHVDVNGLKSINALYGVEYGDFTLKQVAKLLSKFVQQDLFRIGNGEFVALCPNINLQNFNVILERLRRYEAANEEFSFAIGDAWQGFDVDILLAIENSGEIMRAEKQKYYLARPKDLIQKRVNSIEIILRELQENVFSIYLQPKVNLLTKEIVGAEALIRKKDKWGKLIPPDKFVPMYEHDGTIRHVDFFALEQVCIVLQYLIKRGCPLVIAVNFSRVTFICYDLVEEIKRICQKYDVPHKYIRLEITENVDTLDYDFFENKIRNIREGGFEVSLDDFGMKQANFAMMTIPYFSEVKIDKMLLDSMDKSEKNVVIVRHILTMIDELGMSSCVVEGIEREEQRQKLLELGCKLGQGFLFYKPLSAEEFIKEYCKNL